MTGSTRTRLIAAVLFTSILVSTASRAASLVGGEYEGVGYNDVAVDNPVARLFAKVRSGETHLEYHGRTGYLESILAGLGINSASQVLVFSKTSLQYPLIDTTSPRAIYFSEDTYIAWVQGSTLMEVTTMDAKLGPVFYLFHNEREPKEQLERETNRCLVCHDRTGMMGGGIPDLLAQSSIYDKTDMLLKEVSRDNNVDDTTALQDRWGGWYVTGQSGKQKHLGNIQLSGPEELAHLDAALRINLDTLADQGFFDTSHYLQPTSDITALMIMEHQLTVQNQLTYVKFKAPMVLARSGNGEVKGATSWDALPENARMVLTRMLDQLVRVLLRENAIEFTDPVSGSADFETWFQAQGPHTATGLSLRELDLEKRLFKYHLSYLVYSEYFDTLPAYAKDYVYHKLADILQGREQSASYPQLSASERQHTLEILKATKADFVPYISADE